MLGIDNQCHLSSSSSQCIASHAFVVESSPDFPIGNVNALANLLLTCFETISNNSSNFSHRLILYVDQPVHNSTKAWKFPSDVGHTFIGLEQTDPINGLHSLLFGFYPEAIALPGNPQDPGLFKNNENHEFDIAIAWDVSASDFNALIQNIQNSGSMYQNYNLNTNNCTNFARWACNSIGLTIPVGVGVWVDLNPFGTGLIPVVGESPGALGQVLRSLPQYPNEAYRNPDTGQAVDSTCH